MSLEGAQGGITLVIDGVVNLTNGVTGILSAPHVGAAGSTGSVQYNNGGVLGGFGNWNGSTLTIPGVLDMGNNAINNATALNMLSGATISMGGGGLIAGLGDIYFDGNGGGIHDFGDSVAYPGAVLDMNGGSIQNLSSLVFSNGGFVVEDGSTTDHILIASITNNLIAGDAGGGGVEIGANGDAYGIRRNEGTDPLEIGYNDNTPGRGANFFSGGFDYGAVKFFNSGGLFASIDTSNGRYTFSPIEGFFIDGAIGGATVQLTVSGSSGAGNYAIQAIGGQVGLMGTGTDGLTTGRGYVGYGFGPIAGLYADSGTYGLYSNVSQNYLAGKTGFGTITSPSATIDIAAGSTSLLPIKLHSGAVLTSPVAGGIEFLTDKTFLTITTGTARKEFTLNDAALTSGKVPVATTNGRLTDGGATSAELAFLSGVTSAIQTQLNGKTAITTTVSLTNQSADIGSTNFTGANIAGLYQVNYSLQDTTSDLTAGAVTLTIAYTDGAGAATATATQVLTGTGRVSGTVFIQLASGSISYSTSHTGIFGSAKYALYMTVERLL